MCLTLPNLTSLKEEAKALEELRNSRSSIKLTVDNGMAKVMLDKHDYISKMEDLLEQSDTYRTLPADPNNKQKDKLININH